MISYAKLFELLDSRNIKIKDFESALNIKGSGMQRLRHNEHMSTKTICKICEYLNCQPNDIMTVLYNGNNKDQERINSLKRQLESIDNKMDELEKESLKIQGELMHLLDGN